MRLIGFLPFLLLGLLAGYLVGRIRARPTHPGLLVAGVLGSVAGLWARDVLDVTWGGSLYGSLLAALLGGLVLALVVSLVIARPDP